MKIYSNTQPPVYQVIGQALRIHWDFGEEVIEGETIIFCQEAICNKADSRDTIIEKIMASEYTTGAELAAINNGGEDYEAYQSFRANAKSLADGWFSSQIV